MVYMGLILALLFSFTAHGIVPSGVPAKVLGGTTNHVASMPHAPGSIAVPVSDRNEFTLYAVVMASEGVGGDYFTAFYKNGVKYQVPTGYSTRCDAVTHWGELASQPWQFVSSQTSYARGASSITSGTYQTGASGVYQMHTSTTAYARMTEGIQYVFVSESYPGIQMFNSSRWYSVAAHCRETAN